MELNIKLDTNYFRIPFLLLLVGLTVLAGRIIVLDFLEGTFSDERLAQGDLSGISAALKTVPNSSRLRARLAELQFQDWNKLGEARENVDEAIRFAPNDYNLYLLKAKIYEATGNNKGAEDALLDATRLAPYYTEVHWRAGNFYLRQNEMNNAVERFKVVARLNPQFVPAILDLVWALSEGNVPVLKSIVKDNPLSQLNLAVFLARKGQAESAEKVFSSIDKRIISEKPATNLFFVNLMEHGYPNTAQRLLLETYNIKNETGVLNGGFEIVEFKGPPKFDWVLKRNRYVDLRLSEGNGHTGNYSLQIDFKGQETTRLANEITHVLALPPDKSLRMTFFVRTEKLMTETGPKVAVETSDNGVIGESAPIPTGSNEWKCVGFDIVTPDAPRNSDGNLLNLKVKKQNKYAFERPTYGRVWFDDFSLSEGKSPC